jgi:hypothetical protein
MKVVINQYYGGFGLSDKAFERYLKIKDIAFESVLSKHGIRLYFKAGHLDDDNYYLSEYDIERDDPALVQVVEELGLEANGLHSSLKIVEIPDDVKWYIFEYDGWEKINEEHRTWF